MSTDSTEDGREPAAGWALFAVPPSATPGTARSGTGARRVVTDPRLRPDRRAEGLFWEHVIASERCWYWVGAVSTPDGYGRFTFRRNNRQRSISAHRFALLLAHPEIDEDQFMSDTCETFVAEHYCNEPLCVRVDNAHVRSGTQRNNLAFAVGLGRHQGGRATSTINRAARSLMVRSYLLDGGNPDDTARLFGTVATDDQLGLF